MKKLNRNLSILLIVSMMICWILAFTVSAAPVAEDDEIVIEIVEDFSDQNELQPMSVMSSDQYANRYFDSLEEAKQYYGLDYTYTGCEVFYHPAGCYGGYWSNGGYYNYYYTMSDGSRVYLHIGV